MKLPVFPAIAALLGLAAPLSTLAQAPGFSLSVTPIFMADTSLDQGGKTGMTSWQLSGSGSRAVGSGTSLGLQLRYEHQDWQFSSPTALGGVSPWQSLVRYGVGLPINFTLNDGWRLNLTPRADWSGEDGADPGDALGLGLTAGVIKVFSPGKMVGIGLGVFDDLDETRVIPFVLVDWKFDNGLRLANPLPVSPSGPAGLELSYGLGGGWDVGAGLAHRTNRFRLASDNRMAARGVAEIKNIPGFLRTGYASRDGWRIDLYAGAFFGSELRIEDQNGNLIAKDKFGNAPSVAANFSLRF